MIIKAIQYLCVNCGRKYQVQRGLTVVNSFGFIPFKKQVIVDDCPFCSLISSAGEQRSYTSHVPGSIPGSSTRGKDQAPILPESRVNRTPRAALVHHRREMQRPVTD